MKKLIILTSVIFAFALTTANAKIIYNRNIDVNVFYGALDPYGEWVEVGYDDYVWRPYKSDYDWRPYAEGRWEWTRHGWYWESYEPFGWATYHYGRWYHDDYYGWVWMPDNVWAPAWVEWRYNDNYIGWAPLPPYARFNHRHGIHFSINWNSGHFYWSFVKYHHFGSYNIHNHFVHKHYVKNVYKRTKYRTNYFTDNNRIVNGGVSRKFVERKIGKKFTTRKISRTDRFTEYKNRNKKNRNGIVDYRPSVKNSRSMKYDKSKIKKGRALKSFRSDKVALNRKNELKKSTNTTRNRVDKKAGNDYSSNKREVINKRKTDKSKKITSTKRKTSKVDKNNRSEKRSKINKSNKKLKNNSVKKDVNKKTSKTKSVSKRVVKKSSSNKVKKEAKRVTTSKRKTTKNKSTEKSRRR